MTQLSGGELQFGTSRSGGIQAPRTGIDQQLNAPGVTPLPPVEGGMSKLAQGVQSILASTANGLGQLQQTLHNEHVKQVEAEMNVAYEHFLKGVKNPAFTTKEAQDFYFKLEGQRDKIAFDVDSVVNLPGESDGAALARTIETIHGGMPLAYRAQMYEGIIPKMAEKRARETMIEQKRILSEAPLGVAKAHLDNNPEARSMHEAGKAIYLSKGGTEQGWIMATVGDAISAKALAGDPDSVARINQLDKEYGVSNIDAEFMARQTGIAETSQQQVVQRQRQAALNELDGMTNPLQIEAYAHQLRDKGVLDNSDLAKFKTYAAKVRESNARGDMARMSPLARLNYLNGKGGSTFDSVELSKLQKDTLNEVQTAHADGIVSRVIQAKPGMEHDASMQALSDLQASHARYIANPNDPSGISNDKYMSERNRVISLKVEKSAANERDIRLKERDGSADKSSYPLSQSDADWFTGQLNGTAVEGVKDEKTGKFTVTKILSPWVLATKYNAEGIQDNQVSQGLANGLSVGGSGADIEKGIEYGYTLYANSAKPGTHPNYIKYREQLTDDGRMRLDAAIMRLEVSRPAIGSPEWGQTLKQVSLASSKVDTSIKVKPEVARATWTGKASPTVEDVIKPLKQMLDAQDFTDDWARRFTTGGVEVRGWDVATATLLGPTAGPIYMARGAISGGRKFDLAGNVAAVQQFGDYMDQEVAMGVPIEKAKANAYNRLLGNNPPGVWNGQVTMLFDSPYIFTREHEDAMFKDLTDWNTNSKRDVDPSYYKAFCKLQWDPSIMVKDPSGTGKDVKGAFVLMDTVNGERVGGDQTPFAWRPLASKSESHKQMTERMTREAEEVRNAGMNAIQSYARAPFVQPDPMTMPRIQRNNVD